MKPGKQKKYIAPGPYGEVAELWALRILALPGIVQELSRPQQYFPLIMEMLGACPEDEKLSAVSNLQERIQHSLAYAEKQARPSGALFGNLNTLGAKLGLDEIDQGILAFKVLIDLNMLLDEFSNLETRRTYQTARIIGAVIGASAERVHRALSPTGKLRRLRIIEFNSFFPSLSSKLQLHQGVSDALLTEWESPEDIIRLWAYPSPQSSLALDDFPHLEEEIHVLKNIIQTASQTGRRGINFLIHGKPGNGKTELSRLVAGMAGTQSYEVPLESKDGKSLEAHARLDAFNTAQYLLANKGECAIIYDEVEDAFTGRKKLLSEDNNLENQDRKAWINRLLEDNPVPAIWIANQISHLDPAYLRRFTYILEVQAPPRSVRARLLNEKLGALGARKAWTDKMAEDARLTPAIINQMALLASSTAMTNAESVEALCEKSWRHRLSAARETFALRTGSATSYHLEFTNTSPGIEGIEAALARIGKGKLLLYGPPGTGKTELAHHVSRHLNRPLMSKRASDIMSPWVGETEKNMARMFRKAASDGAVLLLDEADGFLQDRGQALRNWEVTEVNELLTQMEQFNGVFICTTNLIDRIDQAAFRRFGLKVRFDYLGTEQRWPTFLHFFGSSVSGLDAASTATLRKRIESMDRLTPGDFSAVQAQQEIRGNMAASDIVEAIAEEYRLKPGSAKNAIGFLT